MSHPHDSIPFCVDLDGTLVRTDLSLESLIIALRSKPWTILLVPIWLIRGRHYLKARLAEIGAPRMETLPFNQSVLQLIETARWEGRRTVLITGSTKALAQRIQEHLGLFDEVHASDQEVNLTGRQKAARLLERFGANQFEYAGNARVDIPIWKVAAAIVTVSAPRSVVQSTRRAASGRPHADLPGEKASARHWFKGLRLHQWAKNALIFVPLAAAHEILDVDLLVAAMIAFFCFGLIASGTYIVNDLFDLESDRIHPTKRDRPFASGAISIQSGVAAAALLIASGFALSGLLPLSFTLILSAYLTTTLLYSVRLKRIASLDVIVLAGLYTLRIIAGAFAVGVPLSFWLLALSMFLFLCLALVKRVAELLELQREQGIGEGNNSRAHGREYEVEDVSVLQMLGTASGYIAVLVLALYINSPGVGTLYSSPELLWLLVPLGLLWVTRIWIITARGYMHEDPIVFAIKDPETWLTGACSAGVMIAAAVVEAQMF